MAVADILVGPVKCYYAPVGEALPARDTVAYGAAWAGNWVAFGYTKEAPITLNYEPTFGEVKINEALAAVKHYMSAEAVTLETVLAELTADNLSLLLGKAETVVAAGVATVGYEAIAAGGPITLAVKQWGFEGLYTSTAGVAFPVRVYIYRGVARLNGALEFSKEDYPGISLQILGEEDMGKTAGVRTIYFERITAAVTG